MRILVTGSEGYIGSALFEHLHQRQIVNVFGLDRAAPLSCCEFLHVDLTASEERIRDTLLYSGNAFDVVFHLAAESSVKDSMTFPGEYWDRNVLATRRLLRCVKAKRFVFASTCAVYGEAMGDIFSESSCTRPISVYGETKRAAEDYVRSWCKAFETECVILRLGNVAGYAGVGKPDTKRFIPRTLYHSMNCDSLQVYGDPNKMVRSFVGIRDVLAVLDKSMTATPGTYNVTSERHATLMEVMRMVGKMTSLPMLYDMQQPLAGDPQKTYMTSRKLRGRWGVEFKQDLQDMIQSQYNAMK